MMVRQTHHARCCTLRLSKGQSNESGDCFFGMLRLPVRVRTQTQASPQPNKLFGQPHPFHHKEVMPTDKKENCAFLQYVFKRKGMKMKMKKICFIIVTLMVLSIPLSVQAAVFNVSSVAQFRQALINATNNNEDDTINVATGNYDVSGGTLNYAPGSGVDFGSDNHALTIQGAGAGQTILDGGHTVQILFINPLVFNANASIAISGITFKNGNAFRGAGLQVTYTGGSVTLEDCLFVDNVSSSFGGGASISASNIIVTRNTFQRNSVLGFDWVGGGIFVSGGTLTLTRNTFIGNRAPLSSGGGGAGIIGSVGSVTNNTFSDNSATFGGGLYLEGASELEITNNTITGNTADLGGGVHIAVGSVSISLSNNIITGNLAISGGNDGDDLYASYPVSGVSLFYNVLGPAADFVSGESEDLVVRSANYTQGFNTNQDPQLGVFTDNGISGNGHFPLLAISPAIDAGNNDECPETDQLGMPRPVDGNNDGIATCDIGSIEFSPVVAVSIDIKPGSYPNSINPRSHGKIPVAILTTDTFDATTVDSTTIRFGATGTEAAPVRSALQDVDGDGDTDMVLHFKTQETGIACGDTSASLTGKTSSGQAIAGSDSIKTVGCK